MKTLALILCLAAACFHFGCASASQGSVSATEERKVTVVKDEKMRITVTEPLSFSDFVGGKELTFPQGVYALEAEDDTYRYFGCTNSIQLKEVRGGGNTGRNMIRGGIALAKNSSKAAAYQCTGEHSMTLVWNLESEFLGQHGRHWQKSF